MTDKQSPETEARILAAAHRVFIRKGSAGARMQDIAAEAGVNQALLHYYFRSKDRLATAVFAQAANRLFPAVAAILMGDAPLARKIEQLVDEYIETVRQRPFIPPYIVAELHHHPERLLQLLEQELPAPPATIVGGLMARLQAQIDAEVAAGCVRPIAAPQLLASILGLCIFPFLARPILGLAIGAEDAKFDAFLEERRRELPGFIIRGIAP